MTVLVMRAVNDAGNVCTQLQFLFELPVRLQKFLDTEAYSQAVRYDEPHQSAS